MAAGHFHGRPTTPRPHCLQLPAAYTHDDATQVFLTSHKLVAWSAAVDTAGHHLCGIKAPARQSYRVKLGDHLKLWQEPPEWRALVGVLGALCPERRRREEELHGKLLLAHWLLCKLHHCLTCMHSKPGNCPRNSGMHARLGRCALDVVAHLQLHNGNFCPYKR